MARDVHTETGEDLYEITKSDLFSTLLPDEKLAVANWAEVITLKKGKTLFCSGDEAKHLYLLREGLIRIFKRSDDGKNEEIARFAPGDNIGDFDFARGAQYDAHAEALEDSKLVMFPASNLTMNALALQMPQVFSRLVLNFTAMVASRIKSTRKLMMENMTWVQELYRKAYEDPGTGLWNQTFMVDEIGKLLDAPVALIMIKPDRFKILVDALGHGAGDKAMVKIARILKSATRKLKRGWALRFKSNETGLLINKCNAAQAQMLSLSLSKAIACLPPVSMKDAYDGHGGQDFCFSASIAWGIWPNDNEKWTSFFETTYDLLLDTWKSGGNKIVRYKKAGSTE
ncbi:MAG: cyclic nucleotide-binding domain-containing protein [Treponema sp.]|jgi:diguanylate cyclase (GGDEF)-like protein|nr:cyclic nucleotide-binding domain-containing protein [Treponema sp.]